MKYPDLDKESQSSILRTPLHLAAIRGHTSIVRVLTQVHCEIDAKDFDQNTPLHYASEFGHFECIIFLVKESLADPLVKNKFGYMPSDIAQNYQIRQLFDSIVPQLKDSESYYGRTAFQGVLLHNDRINSVQKLMHTYKHVNKYLCQHNQ